MKPVIMKKDGEILTFESVACASRYFNTNQGCIRRVIKGKRKSYKGWSVEFAGVR